MADAPVTAQALARELATGRTEEPASPSAHGINVSRLPRQSANKQQANGARLESGARESKAEASVFRDTARTVLPVEYRGREIGDLVVQRTAEVSDSIFSTYLLPFEVISVLLLAALIGAIVLARRD